MIRVLPLFVLSVLLSVALCKEGNSRFHSAKCLALGKECNEYLETQSGFCKMATSPRKQSSGCYKLACQWCAVEGKKEIFPCTAKVLVKACKGKKKMPAPSMEPMKKKKKGTRKMTPTPRPMKKKRGMKGGKMPMEDPVEEEMM